MKWLTLVFLFLSLTSTAQFTKYDSLRGELTPARSAYDITFYDLNLEITPEDKSIKGSNKFVFELHNRVPELQIDLFSNLTIDSILSDNQKLGFRRDSNAVFINVPQDGFSSFTVFYRGQPIIAENPPWDGGFIWTKDTLGRNWISVACEGTGASSWWPCKDHLSDEPDSMEITFTVPAQMIAISNGSLLIQEKQKDGTSSYKWQVTAPINTYNVTLYAGQYAADNTAHPLTTSNGIDFYPLDYNHEVARSHFMQADTIISIYEKYFGPYPFPEDGYKLVEAPYWGMEHQSAIAYGNNYTNDVLGYDFIILHETAHEWWGNNLSVSDHGDMWVHEAFATYAEAIFFEEIYGPEQALQYLQHQKARIKNNMPVQGPLHVNYDEWEDADMYYKGSWMLHTIRSVINNDPEWFTILRALQDTFHHSVISGEQIKNYMNEKTEENLIPVFNQYLNYTSLPCLEIAVSREKKNFTIRYRWNAKAEGFSMPVDIFIGNEKHRIRPGQEFRELSFPLKGQLPAIKADTSHFYITEEITVQN